MSWPARAALGLAVLAFLAGAPGGAVPRADAAGATASVVNADRSGGVPFQVAVVAVTSGTIAVPLQVFCGGTVRDATHILTAAHCVRDIGAAQIAVVAGAIRRSSLANTQVRTVAAITSDPAFELLPPTHDLAILTLSTALTFNTRVQPLPIVGVGGADVGTRAQISGWGDTDPVAPGAQQPDELLAATVDVLAPTACWGYGTVFDDAVHLCAGSIGARTVDSCQGDSGGPLARLDDGEPDVLIGVVSFGRGCADPAYPGVYARLGAPAANAFARQAVPPARLEPVPGAPPSVTGALSVGRAVTCAPGGWTDRTARYDVTWQSGAVDAQGAITDLRAESPGPTLALGPGVGGRFVGCRVRATNAGGARTADSAFIGPVGAATTVAVVPQSTDATAPRARITKRRCVAQRCTVTLSVSDPGGRVVRTSMKLQRLTGCAKGARGAACRRARTFTARRLKGTAYAIRTPKLSPARYRFTIVATDAASNRSAPLVVLTTIRRR